MLDLWFDGGCGPNPGGLATWGYVLRQGGRKLAADGGIFGHGAGMTNNVAEYAGLFMGLQKILSLGLEGVSLVVRGDSSMVVKQMSGEMRAYNWRPYYSMHVKCRAMLDSFSKVRFEWIPRGQNKEADGLATGARRSEMASQTPAEAPVEKRWLW